MITIKGDAAEIAWLAQAIHERNEQDIREQSPTRSAPPEKKYRTVETLSLTAQVQENPPPPTEVNPNVSPRFSEIILKMLERDPQRRYSLIDQVHDELVELRENLLVNNNS